MSNTVAFANYCLPSNCVLSKILLHSSFSLSVSYTELSIILLNCSSVKRLLRMVSKLNLIPASGVFNSCVTLSIKLFCCVVSCNLFLKDNNTINPPAKITTKNVTPSPMYCLRFLACFFIILSYINLASGCPTMVN